MKYTPAPCAIRSPTTWPITSSSLNAATMAMTRGGLTVSILLAKAGRTLPRRRGGALRVVEADALALAAVVPAARRRIGRHALGVRGAAPERDDAALPRRREALDRNGERRARARAVGDGAHAGRGPRGQIGRAH